MSILLWNGCASFVCREEEQAVLAEFPQYDEVQVTPEGNVDTGACAVYYDVPDPPDQVRNYFIEQLTAYGWTVEAAPPSGTLVEAQRGQFSYLVYYEAMESYPTPRPGTHLAVHVARD